ncbi:MAG TPA: S9 family peptidase [Gemmatimonadales bacterium]|jgi:dipeptidyl aminopeptidase/acylaminoacyl peptidase|nr:S9 family peptidase [Gemmatimonadales bacterium]
MRPVSRFPFLVVVAALLFAPAVAWGQETASDTLLTVNHYLDWEQVSDPQISPDGSQIVYTRRWVNKVEDRWDSALWIMNTDGSKNRFLVKGSNARWSPDGARIAYFADGEPKGTQLFVRWMDAEGATSQVTRVSENPGNLSWAPDGRSLAFTMLVKNEPTWRISMPSAPEGAKWTPAPRMVDRLHYRRDRTGFIEQGTTHLFLVPAEGGTPRQLTSGDFGVSELGAGLNYDWTPDGKSIVFDGLREPDADHRYRESYLYTLDVATGAVRQLVTTKGQWANPEVSPDGRSVAFTGRPYGTFSYRANEVWTVGIDGNGMRALTTYDRDPGGLEWAPDGSGVYFVLAQTGTSNVHFAPLSGAARKVTDGVQMLSLTSIARDLTAVGTLSDPDDPGDVVRYSLRRPQPITRLTNVNADVLAGVRLGRVEEVWYTSSGGARVQGWIVKPPGFDPSKKYPLIMEIHGGPHGMYNVGFNYQFQNFAANGYVVLYTNPRGSTGYGSPFGNAIERAYPSVDYDDLMAGVDTVVARGYIDTQRMYVGGCSGGGVLSSWVIGHTTRFAAAAVRCPVIDWISMAGTTDIPLFTYGFFDAPYWEKPEQWLKQSSLMYVGNVKTPTLLMTGELDLRTPMPQTEEYYSALKYLKVPAVMLRFSGEYHGTSSKPSNFLRTQLYMMSWYQKHKLGGETVSSSEGNK